MDRLCYNEEIEVVLIRSRSIVGSGSLVAMGPLFDTRRVSNLTEKGVGQTESSTSPL